MVVKHKKNLKIFGLLFLLIFSINKGNSYPLLEFSNSSTISLNKEGWKFYFEKTYEEVLRSPNQGAEDIIVPGGWGYLGHPNQGYGTYVYKFVHGLHSNEALSLILYNVGTNYDLFINGKLVKSVGVFGKDEKNSFPDFSPVNVSFHANQDTMEIALQVSNFYYREGGIWFSPTIGLEENMDSIATKQIFVDSFLVGSLFVLFCYFVAFYYMKTEDKTSLWFALMCLFAALRIASTGIVIIRQVQIAFPWELLVKTEFSSLTLMLLFGVLYMNSLFPKDVNAKMLKITTGIQLLVVLVFLLLPVKYASHIIPYYLFFCAFLLFYLLNLAIKAMYVKRPFANWAAGVFILVFFAGFNDILHSQGLITTFYLMPIGIFIFAIVQALTLTKMFSNAFVEVETLSVKLKNINQNQKEIIHERTSLLNSQAQELQRSNQIKDKVFSIIAHDLRAPIKSLSTVLAWVADDDLTYDELKKSLNSISKNVDTLNLTLENLLQWSRSQLSGVKSEPELLDLRKPVQEMTELYKIQMAEKGIQFKNEVLERYAVYIDKHHLNLLFRNLISNAIKFTKEGGTITISGEAYDSSHTLVCIKDSGVGMDAEAIRKVFSPTEHYTTYGTNNEKGTGLGLLLCKEYVESSDGKIWIESTIGVGTTICFTLPNHS
jgi:two-component system, sensor histidine kinase ChiS